MILREGFGQDDVPDQLFINNKLIDTLGHIGKGLNSSRMGDAVRTQDAYLKKFVAFLDENVGEGKWAMVLTADHGATPFPGTTGAFVVSPGKVGAAITERFDGDGDDREVLQFVQPTQVFLDKDELADNGYTLEDVARFILTLTKSRTNENAPPSKGEADEPVFSAAIPSFMFATLPCWTRGHERGEDLKARRHRHPRFDPRVHRRGLRVRYCGKRGARGSAVSEDADGGYVYDGDVAIEATLGRDGEAWTLRVANHTGRELGPPGIYGLAADDGRRIDADVSSAAPVPPDGQVELSVTFPGGGSSRDFGLVMLIFGQQNFGPLAPA